MGITDSTTNISHNSVTANFTSDHFQELLLLLSKIKNGQVLYNSYIYEAAIDGAGY